MVDPRRENFEAWHGELLAPYAIREADSGARRHSEAEHSYRTCFQRDRDRIVHCSAFRRLDFKTQVFVPHEDDHFRTRLTHTLEVAQVGRTLARALGLNEDLVEAVALGKDPRPDLLAPSFRAAVPVEDGQTLVGTVDHDVAVGLKNLDGPAGLRGDAPGRQIGSQA